MTRGGEFEFGHPIDSREIIVWIVSIYLSFYFSGFDNCKKNAAYLNQ